MFILLTRTHFSKQLSSGNIIPWQPFESINVNLEVFCEDIYTTTDEWNQRWPTMLYNVVRTYEGATLIVSALRYYV